MSNERASGSVLRTSVQNGDGSGVWADSNSHPQSSNLAQDAREESTFLDEVVREIQRVGTQRRRQSDPRQQ
jgi:hypothetical protein